MGYKKVLAKIYIQRAGFHGLFLTEDGTYHVSDPHHIYSNEDSIQLTAQELSEIFMEIATEQKMQQLKTK